MRLKLTLFLFIANMVVFGLILYRDAMRNAPEERRVAGILGPEVQDALTLRISSLGEDRITRSERRFTREGEHWFLQTPFEWPARRDAVDRILAQLQFIEPEIEFDIEEIERAGKTLADYGLDPARIELSLDLPDGRTVKVGVGAPTEIGDRVYVLGMDQQTVFVTSRSLLASLAVDLEIVRDARVFSIQDYEVRQLITRITTNGDLTIRLARTESAWQFESPIQVDADRTMVENTLEQLNALEAIRFIAPDERSGAGAIVDPLMRITLEGSRGRETLILGAAPDNDPSVYLAQRQDRDSQFLVPAAPFETLLTAQRALRDRDFLQLDAEKINAITLRHGNEVALTRLENGQWQVLDQNEDQGMIAHSADFATVSKLIDSIVDVRALEFVSDVPTESDLARFGLVPPVWEIEISLDESEDTTFLVGNDGQLIDGSPVVYGKRADEPFVYALRRRTTATWIQDPLYYRNRLIQRLSPQSQISSLKVERIGETTETLMDVSIDPRSETWPEHIKDWPTETQGPAYDLIEMLGELRVERFLEDTFDETGLNMGNTPEPWSLKLSYSLALPTDQTTYRIEERSLYLTRRLSGSFQAGGAPWLDMSFQLPAAMINTLHDLFFEREPSGLYQAPPAEAGGPAGGNAANEPDSTESQSAVNTERSDGVSAPE